MPVRAYKQIRCKGVPLSMWLELARRISMIMLIVAIATGFSVPALQAQSHHGQMVASVAMSADNPAGCAHNGCPIDQKADMQGACFAPCPGVSVLPPATTISYLSVALDVLTPSLDRAMVDHTVAPDPHPPKPYALI
jgi:hypothetical protein